MSEALSECPSQLGAGRGREAAVPAAPHFLRRLAGFVRQPPPADAVLYPFRYGLSFP